MNMNFLQISLLFLFLVSGLRSPPALADCFQEELCDAQMAVNGLLEEIVAQQEAIEVHWQSLDSQSGWNIVLGFYERARRYMDVGSRYLFIGTLESRLLVAYNKLGSVRAAADTFDPICHCNDDIQLSAGY